MNKKNGMLAMILSRAKDNMKSKFGPAKEMSDDTSETEVSNDSEDSGENEDLNIASEDVIAAINSGDAKALAEALKAFIQLCDD